MDAAKREQAEKESQARMIAEKVMFTENEVSAKLEPHQEDTPVMKGRIAPCDEDTKVSKKSRAKVDAMKNLYGF
jgi:hypothetical protein